MNDTQITWRDAEAAVATARAAEAAFEAAKKAAEAVPDGASAAEAGDTFRRVHEAHRAWAATLVELQRITDAFTARLEAARLVAGTTPEEQER